MAALPICSTTLNAMLHEHKPHVIPGRAKSANPESSDKLRDCIWIPDRRCAASGMTWRGHREFYRLSHLRAKPSRPCGMKMMMAMKMKPSGIR
jgi:hypothetical protein